MFVINAENALEKMGATVLRLAYSRVGNLCDAQDIFQEVFVKAAQKKLFESEEHQKAWIIRVTINLCNNLLKKNKKTVGLEDNFCSPQGDNVDIRLDVVAALRTLAADAQSVIFLHYYEGYSFEQISKILKLNANTIRSIHLRARQKLKQLLSQD